MSLQANVIMIAVQDLARSKKFYQEGLGCQIEQDYPQFVSLNLGEGSSSLALYPWDNAAQDAGVPAQGSGFRGVSFHCLVSSSEAVDEIMAKAVAAGGTEARPPAAAQWGGYFGYFADPDGHLWKVTSP
jgi:catechol 2,3-dioxygenase-like lactoylglutathione lyase family enzyme